MINPDDHLPTPKRRSAVSWALLLLRGVLAIVSAAGMWWVSHRLVLSVSAEQPGYVLLLPLLMMAVVLAGFGWQELHWYRPRRLLMERMDHIVAGRMPIESLGEIGGGLGPVASACRGLLHRARASEAKVAELNQEMSQRVRNRTDALQRIIGGLRQQAIRDPLTGLHNRRALDELLPRLIEQAEQREEDLSLLMIDVDYFKQLNDQLGHAAGDEALKAISQLIRSCLGRNQDIAFRCGGDEFVIVLGGCPPEPARQVAERLAALVQSYGRTLKSNPRPKVSIGTCSLSELSSPSASDLLREADRRLYEVKHARCAGRPAA
ncbi:MAG: GGDEF domain-containing protein [Phycisphaerae bacterium]|nr:GGDEF domain-containing protein [Phycisphaerae bacterium]MDW8262522.1 GGDEF domain-containing protein [Phycisphaerales bacterium]